MAETVKIKIEKGLEKLPVITLRGLVAFPNNVIHFEVGRPRSIASVAYAMENTSRVFLVTQKDLETEEPTLDDVYRYGVVAEINQVLKAGENAVKVLVEGKYRAKLIDFTPKKDVLMATVKPSPIRSAKGEISVKMDAAFRNLKETFEYYLHLNPKISKEVIFTVAHSENPGTLCEFLASNFPMRYQNRQAILEENSLLNRIHKLSAMIRYESQVLEMENDIDARVEEQMDKNQREYYLREQMHVIAQELGDPDDTAGEAAAFRQKIDSLPLNDEARDKLLKETDRFSKLPSSSQEASVSRAYLDTCLDLPWDNETVDKLNVLKARQILDRDHYGLEKVKDKIIELLAVRKLKPDIQGQIICLVGPPGVGKTSIARSVAECMGRKFARISLGGIHDEAEIRGHRRTYIGSMPGKIISALQTAKTKNPLILLDEIDKLSNDYRGDPSSALLEVLDPEQNSTFKDNYIDIPFDLSDVLFITTANRMDSIPGPLLDRMDVIELPSYTRVEKYNIAKKHLIPKQLEKNGLTGKVSLQTNAIYGLIDYYVREAGVRSLERTIVEVLRKCAKTIVETGSEEKVLVKKQDLEGLLGPHRVKQSFLNRSNAVGITNGLAWTSVGGETLPIEVISIPGGKGNIEVTGSLGDVMKESAKIAFSYVRANAEAYGINRSKLTETDIHIHAPEGAIPKDGPSAGVTLTTSLVSCLANIPVRSDVAMTGEISLHGNVLPIGGLREKSMAAYREGMKTVLIPAGNQADLKDVDPVVLSNINFIPVSHLNEVLKYALIRE